jgi:hypothetical protein
MLVNMQMPTAPASLARRSSAIASLAKSHGSEAIHFTSITISSRFCQGSLERSGHSGAGGERPAQNGATLTSDWVTHRLLVPGRGQSRQVQGAVDFLARRGSAG